MTDPYQERSVKIAKAMNWKVVPYEDPTAQWGWSKDHMVVQGNQGHAGAILTWDKNFREFVRIENADGDIIAATPLTPRSEENLDHEDYWALLPNFYADKNLYLARRAIAWGIDNEPFFAEWLLDSNHLLRIIVNRLGSHDALDQLLHHISVTRTARPDDA